MQALLASFQGDGAKKLAVEVSRADVRVPPREADADERRQTQATYRSRMFRASSCAGMPARAGLITSTSIGPP